MDIRLQTRADAFARGLFAATIAIAAATYNDAAEAHHNQRIVVGPPGGTARRRQ